MGDLQQAAMNLKKTLCCRSRSVKAVGWGWRYSNRQPCLFIFMTGIMPRYFNPASWMGVSVELRAWPLEGNNENIEGVSQISDDEREASNE